MHEIGILYRKFIIIFLVEIVSLVSPEVQILILIMAVVYMLYVSIDATPYINPLFNSLEKYQLFSMLSFIYLGFFYVTG